MICGGLRGWTKQFSIYPFEEAVEVKWVEARIGHGVMAADKYLGRPVETGASAHSNHTYTSALQQQRKQHCIRTHDNGLPPPNLPPHTHRTRRETRRNGPPARPNTTSRKDTWAANRPHNPRKPPRKIHLQSGEARGGAMQSTD